MQLIDDINEVLTLAWQKGFVITQINYNGMNIEIREGEDVR